MDALPSEILLLIASYLDPIDIVRLQLLSRRFLSLTRDNNLWKAICFDNSRAEALRRRQALISQLEPRLQTLARAMEEIEQAAVDGEFGSAERKRELDVKSKETGEVHARSVAARKRMRALASWDPSYPGEKVDFYQEYIHRHAPLYTDWFEAAESGEAGEKGNLIAATGVGTLHNDEGLGEKIIAPLEDGSIAIWDIWEGKTAGHIVARTQAGLLSDLGSSMNAQERFANSKAIMTETGAVECVAIDNRYRKGFFAVNDVLNEVDLTTLQIISRCPYPFQITAVSEARHPTPLTIGTNWTLHLHDTRQRQPSFSSASSARVEMIGGTPPPGDGFSQLLSGESSSSTHSSLSQSGPLSIVHLPEREWDGNGDIWVAGRFTSLLNYDRRFFPRLRGTVHSGARLSCLTSIPYPYLGRQSCSQYSHLASVEAVRDAKEVPGHILVASGEDKGKGSLELYGLSSHPEHNTFANGTLTSSSPPSSAQRSASHYQNRQTASASKLLSVAPHSTRIVYADGDGNVKWVERNGFTPVRQFNINPDLQSTASAQSTGIFSAPTLRPGEGDIVQKLLPTATHSTSSVPLHRDNMILWTGDGRLGMVGFGKKPDFDFEELTAAAKEEENGLKEQEEREFDAHMRRALERQADEVRFMRGLGLA